MLNSEIKVFDVDQTIELFTSLKDKINSLKIVDASNPIDMTPAYYELVASGYYVGTQTPANTARTFTSLSNQNVVAINITQMSDSNRDAASPGVIVTDGEVAAQNYYENLQSNQNYSVAVKSIKLKTNDTIEYKSTLSSFGNYASHYSNFNYFAFSTLIPFNSFTFVSNEHWRNDNVNKDYSVGSGLHLIIAIVPGSANDYGDTSQSALSLTTTDNDALEFNSYDSTYRTNVKVLLTKNANTTTLQHNYTNHTELLCSIIKLDI